MAGGRGVVLDRLRLICRAIACLFGEDQARYLIETRDPDTRSRRPRDGGSAGSRDRPSRRGSR